MHPVGQPVGAGTLRAFYHRAVSTTETPRRLRRELGGWQVVALSIALMAPSMAANINPQLAVPSIGRAVPLAFGIATIGVVLVAYSFVRLTQHFHSSGSVYGFVGATLGPRAGAASGWALLGTYTALGVTTALTAGIFATSLLSSLGIWAHPPASAPYLLGAVVLAAAWPLAVIPIRPGTVVLLACELVTLALILAVSAVVVARLIAGDAPLGQHLNLDVVRVPHGIGASGIALAAVFGFLSFVGFEASGTLGEEARTPRRDIPRAILGTVLVGGVFYTVISAIEVWGFGTSAAGVAALSTTPSLLGHLGTTYVSAAVGDLITAGTVVSAFGCVTASTVGASRLLYALSRDATGGRSPLARLSPRWGTPVTGVTTVVAATGLIAALLHFGFRAAPLDGLSDSAEVATLIVLVVYLLCALGAGRLLWRRPAGVAAGRWEVAVPAAAVAVLGYTLWRNVWPWPSGAAAWLPLVSAAWWIIGLGAVLVTPGLARRIGVRLATDDGLRVASTA